MDIATIIVFAAVAVCSALLPARLRVWALFVVSVIAIYALQPTLDVRWLDYSLPTITLGITALCWLITRHPPEVEGRVSRDNVMALVIMIVVALILTLPRYLDVEIAITSRPPPIETVLIGLAATLVLGGGIIRLPRKPAAAAALGFIIGLFVLLKLEPFTTAVAGFIRLQTGQDPSLAKATDIGWLGFSYVAFRLIHTLRDWQMGILPALNLREYVTYVVFFPAYTAGPIDRVERFVQDLRTVPVLGRSDPQRIVVGSTRILIGMIKKFAIADSLAVFSLSATTSEQVGSSVALWGLLYIYAFRLYFDFSGYSDIAIGIAILCGIKLPENFDRPYLRSSITAFWQSWHATLSAWARAYVYGPLSRRLLKGKRLSNDVIVLVCNITTMIVIGLWHGATLPFLFWGAWHGLGLTLHKWWSDRTRKWYRGLSNTPTTARLWNAAGILLTFHFVLLGWVWFALPDWEGAIATFLRLFGLQG